MSKEGNSENISLKKQRGVLNFIMDKYVYIITFVLAFLMMLMAWKVGKVGPFGGKCLVIVDGVHQYLPFFSEYQEKLKHLSDIQYTFDVGMGNNFISLWSYYLSSPFNLIIILFSKESLPMALNIIISIKIILGAVCFSYMLLHLGKKSEKNLFAVAASLFYTFSSFVVGYYWNLMWLDCIFIFPIIILGMEKMMKKKDSRMYVLALLYSFICNYYISFMICIFLVLWFFTYRFRSFKELFTRGLRFAAASLTAAAMSAVVLLPAYKGIMTTASAKFELPEWEFYGGFADTLRSHLFCSEVLTNQVGDSGTNLYCGIITILLAIMFFFIKEISIEKKIKYGVLLLLFIVSFNNVLLNYIWHGFHNQYGIPNRFAFLYVFILLMMAYEVYLKRDKLKAYMIIISYIISMLFVIFCYFHAEVTYEKRTYVVTIILLALYLMLLVLYTQLPKRNEIVIYLIMIMAVFEMGVNGIYGFYQDGSSDPNYYYGDTGSFQALKERTEIEDDFYRSDIIQPILVDEATWQNLRSVGIFGSTVRGEMVEIMGKLGFYTGANEYLFYGATPVTNALFGVKYAYARVGDFINVDMNEKDHENSIYVYENTRDLPIGYMADRNILTYDTMDNGPFTVQNELAGALTGIEPIFVSIFDDMNVNVYGTNMDIELIDDNNANYSNASKSARADMIYTMPEDLDLYVSCRGSNVHKIALLLDGTEVAYDRYQGQIFHVGNVKKGELVDIQFELNDEDNLSGELYCYPMKYMDGQFELFYNKLAAKGMDVKQVSDTRIKGSINVGKDEIFMTSIPYDEGWSIYADGRKMDNLVLLEGFLGAELPEGEHELEIRYRSPGLLTGAIISLLGIICFIVICRKEKAYEEKGNTQSGDTGSGIGDEISAGNESNSEGNASVG